MRSLAMLLAAAAAIAAAPASAAVLTDMSVYTVGNYTAFGGANIAGRVAVGGNMVNQSDNIGTALTSADNNLPTVIVGGDLTYNYATIQHGSVVYGGQNLSESYLPNRVQTPNGTTSQGNPINFVQRSTGVISTASTLAGLTPTGTFSEFQNNSIGRLEGVTAGATSIFTLTRDDLYSIQTLRLLGTSDATSQVIINIGGTSITSSFVLDLNGLVDANRVLVNFYEATSLDLNGVQLPGTLLAPNARVALNGGRIGDGVVAGSISANTATIAGVGDFQLSPGAAAVPEPAAWLLMIGGFGLVGFMLRRPNALLWGGASA
ncbi:choice-of-anchor A family protein [Sphingomonas sp. 1P06PA]|uniref:collagen-binding domain-containing protein n=1 Tax=Sphingomonas sp. 1P06PA TaxID=554121 RepID=UPI0039A49E91